MLIYNASPFTTNTVVLVTLREAFNLDVIQFFSTHDLEITFLEMALSPKALCLYALDTYTILPKCWQSTIEQRVLCTIELGKLQTNFVGGSK